MVETCTATTALVVYPCCSCGIVFGVPKEWDEKRRADHRDFYCPNGHRLSYPGETKEEGLARELWVQRSRVAHLADQLDCCVTEKKELKRSNRSLHGTATRLRKKIKEATNG